MSRRTKRKQQRRKAAQYDRQNGHNGPANRIASQLPPGAAKPLIPHVWTFQTLVANISKLYVNPDEAYRENRTEVSNMRRDPVIMEPLTIRKLSSALLDWQIEPENENDPVQRKIAEDLTRSVENTPNFIKLKMALLEAIWFGRYAANMIYEWESKIKDGFQPKMKVDRWRPVHGDKLKFQFETDRVGILASRVPEGSEVGRSEEARALMLDETERRALIVHKHEVEDGEFFDGRSAGAIHGIGLRSRVFWPWWLKQKLLGWQMTWAERFGLGTTIWYYEHGNPESEKAVRKAAEEFVNENVILFPRPIGSESQGPGLERVEVSSGGANFFQQLIDEYFGQQIKRMILGQILTSETAPTGMGSNVAEKHAETAAKICKFDCKNLDETLTQEFVAVLAEFNYPGIDWKPRFRTVIQEVDPKEIMESAKLFIELGGDVAEDEIREVAGFRKPREGEKKLTVQSPGMPGQGPMVQGQLPFAS